MMKYVLNTVQLVTHRGWSDGRWNKHGENGWLLAAVGALVPRGPHAPPLQHTTLAVHRMDAWMGRCVFVPAPYGSSPEWAGTFSGQTFCSLAWPWATCRVNERLADGPQAASGCALCGWPAGEHPVAAPRPRQSARVIILIVSTWSNQRNGWYLYVSSKNLPNFAW